MIVLVISVFIIIAWLHIPILIKQKLWRELAAFSVLLGIGFVLSLLQVIGIKIPSPNKGIMILVESIYNIFR
mgnify:CR=1 FL=1